MFEEERLLEHHGPKRCCRYKTFTGLSRLLVPGLQFASISSLSSFYLTPVSTLFILLGLPLAHLKSSYRFVKE
jgi:hypothetical protein